MAASTTEAEYVVAANCCGQNPVYHSKTKHIAIRHHFIRDAYEKKLIQVLKIHTDDNVADLLTKAFDVSRLCIKKDSGNGDNFHEVIWVLESHWKKEVSTEDALGTDKQKVSTDKEEVSTDRPDKGRSATLTTPTPTPTTFGDEETIAQVLLNMSQAKAVLREKDKEVELKDVENMERPRPTSTRSLLTLKPFSKINPKDKKRLAEEEATNADLIQDFDDIKARIKADRLLALRLQEEEREQFTMEERAKFFHDTIAAQRKFLAEQRVVAIRNRPPTRTQLRSQMMASLKHVGNKKHSDLKNKTFEEIQALYEKVKRFDESFTAIGSTEDERKIKEMNEG
ncbi:hypothetical protein Tco_1198812 [Tanacetum coccineum]